MKLNGHQNLLDSNEKWSTAWPYALWLGVFAISILVSALGGAQAVSAETWQESPVALVAFVANQAELVADDPSDATGAKSGLNFLMLLSRGGWFMLPLTVLSILVIGLAIERYLALREEKVMPRRFVKELGRMAAADGEFHPRTAYQLCQRYPSPAAKVVQVMLLKAGRPQTEIEHATAEAAQREANRLNTTVSWLSLIAAVAPLIGLLGTVWGITQAFYVTTTMSAMENKGPALAEGIYTALVTTMFGLAIAIPAAVLAHLFENRIVSWFNKIDEMVLNLAPQLEPFEGHLRTRLQAGEENGDGGAISSSSSSSSTRSVLPR